MKNDLSGGYHCTYRAFGTLGALATGPTPSHTPMIHATRSVPTSGFMRRALDFTPPAHAITASKGPVLHAYRELTARQNKPPPSYPRIRTQVLAPLLMRASAVCSAQGHGVSSIAVFAHTTHAELAAAAYVTTPVYSPCHVLSMGSPYKRMTASELEYCSEYPLVVPRLQARDRVDTAHV